MCRQILCLVMIFSLWGCSEAPESTSVVELSVGEAQKLVLFAAASTTHAVEEALQAFEAETGLTATASFAGSAVLAQQIANGAEAGLFLSAHVEWVEFLAEKGLVQERTDLLGNRLVIVQPMDTEAPIGKPEELRSEAVEYIAIAEPSSVPAGKYALQALTRLGLWESVQDKTIRGADVRQALMFVETGDAEAGIVYSTDAAISQKVKPVYTFDAALTEPIVYPLVKLSASQSNSDYTELYTFLKSETAAAIFRRHGFQWLGNAL